MKPLTALEHEYCTIGLAVCIIDHYIIHCVFMAIKLVITRVLELRSLRISGPYRSYQDSIIVSIQSVSRVMYLAEF